MRKIVFTVTVAFVAFVITARAQQPSIPSHASEDVNGVMSQAYWSIWNDAEQAQIDKDIETYRKADASLKVGRVKRGTTVKVKQISSEFVFGASAFNWNQLGNSESNLKYKKLFGDLFNRATIPFYWSSFERKPGNQRFTESYIDQEEWWNNGSERPKQEWNWRRPATDPIVDWCYERGVQVHGHPLVWILRKVYPTWLQYVGVPEKEQRILDTLEVIRPSFDFAKMSPSYASMTPKQVYDLVPNYIDNVEKRSMKRIEDIMSRYQGRIQSYDIVNESVRDFASGSQNPNEPMCKSVYGITFSDYTFRSFKKAEEMNAGNALLNINDYAIDDTYLNQIADLVSRGAKIDVIGSQMHLFQPQQCVDIAKGTFKSEDRLVTPGPIREYFKKLGSFGIPTCLSEITITSAGEDGNGEMIQAIITRNLYRMWFSLPSMMGITWWNIVDDCGASGEPTISGIFHRDMTPKLAFYALDQLINHEWRTELELKPDSRGNVNWRGFKGKYAVTWTDPSGTVQTKEIELK